jgi:H+/Cl- antiporter ClcA
MLLKPLTRYYVIIAMFIASITYLLFFGYLFGYNPTFLTNYGYDWFPYRLWSTRRNIFRLVGTFMMAVAVFLIYVLFKFNERLFQV